MAISLNDVISIVDVQSLFGQEVLNVYYYTVTLLTIAPSPSLSRVADAFIDVVLGDVANCQSSDLTHTELRLANVTNGIDIYTRSTVVDGTINIPADDSFTAYALRLNRLSAITRSGQKRIAGVDENGVSGNLVELERLDLVNQAGVAMCTALQIETGVTVDALLRPTIVGRNSDGSLDLTRKQFFLTATPNPYISSQVSRKQR